MRRRHLVVFSMCALVLSCAQASKPPAPVYVNVAVVGATILPTKINGMPWDGPPFAKKAMDAAVAAVSVAQPQAAIAAKLAALVIGRLIESSQPPDVRGTVSFVDGQSQVAPQIALAKVQDSFSPVWTPPPTRVLLDDGLHLVVDLEDTDLGDMIGLHTNDPVGRVIVTADDLRHAAAAGGVVQLPVSKQDSGQVLFLAVQVTP